MYIFMILSSHSGLMFFCSHKRKFFLDEYVPVCIDGMTDKDSCLTEHNI